MPIANCVPPALPISAAPCKVHVIGRKRDANVLRPYSPVHPDDETFDELLITNDIYELVEYKAAPWMPIRPRPPPTPPPPPVDSLACTTAP